MTKYIKIEWDETTLKEEHSEGLMTHEVIGMLEVVKFNIWERRIIKKD